MAFKTKQAENSPPGKIVRKTSRAATGGAALLLALLMFMLFRVGPGSSEGEGEQASQKGQPMATTAPPARSLKQTPELTAPPAENPDQLTTDERNALAGNVLTILIDERAYLLQLPGREQPEYRPIALPRLLEIAPLAAGDENGIRVRLLRRENARASAEEQLKLDLAQVGITSSQIYMPEQFVP